MDLDEVADELYGVPPEEFVALRRVRQDDARMAGDRVLAKRIGALGKPSSAAWACNLLVRAHREEIEGLVELGDLLREAQQNLAGDELRALNQQRGRLLTALTRQAGALAREHGHPVSSGVAGQIEETLRAGMSDPEAGQALLTGRLTSAMSYSGMGTTTAKPDLRLIRSSEPAAAERPTSRTPAEPAADARRRAREEEARRAAEDRRRQELDEARGAAQSAAEAAEEARGALEEERARAAELDARRKELQGRVTELADELARAEEEADAVATEVRRAERRRRTAERHAADAETAHEHAVARVQQLTGGSPGR